MAIIEYLQRQHPGVGVARAAVESLQDERQMQSFFAEYAEWLDDFGRTLSGLRAKDLAILNLNLVLQDYPQDVAAAWQQVMDDSYT